MGYLPNPALLSHLPRLPDDIWHIIDKMIHRMYMRELRNNIIYDVIQRFYHTFPVFLMKYGISSTELFTECICGNYEII
jgi:hypothetical protein